MNKVKIGKKLFTVLLSGMLLSLTYSNLAFASNTPTKYGYEIKQLLNQGFTNGDEKTLIQLLDIGFSVTDIESIQKSEFDRFTLSNEKVVSKKEQYARIAYNVNSKVKTIEYFDENNYINQFNKDINEHKTVQASSNNSVQTSQGVISPLSVVSEIHQDGDVSWLHLSTTISYSSTTDQYSLYNFFTWKTNPVLCQSDILGIGVSTNFSYIPNSEYFSYHADHYHYDTTSGSYNRTEYVNKGTHESTGSGGEGFTVPLFQNVNTGGGGYQVVDTYTNHAGYMYYRANLNKSVGTTYANAYGSYSHQSVGITGSPSYSYPSGGSISISLEWTYSKVNATSQVTVN